MAGTLGTGAVNGIISAIGSGPPPTVTIGGVTLNVTDHTVIQVGSDNPSRAGTDIRIITE